MTDVTFTIRLTGEDRGGEAAVRKVVNAVQELRTEATEAAKAVQGITTGITTSTAAPAIDRVVKQVEEISAAEQEAAASATAMGTAVAEGAAKATQGQQATAEAAKEVVGAFDAVKDAQEVVAEQLGRDIPAAAKATERGLLNALQAPDEDLAALITKFNQLQVALSQGPAGFEQAATLAADLERETRGATAAIEALIQRFVEAGGDVTQLPPRFADLAAAYVLVEHNASQLNATLAQGSEATLPAARESAEQLRQALESIITTSAAAGAAQENAGKRSERGATGTKKLERAFEELLFSATGIPGVIGRTASALARFAAGGTIAVTVIAGLGAITAYWRNLTSEIRKNREEADRAADALVDAAFSAQGLDIAQNISLVQGELDNALQKIDEQRTKLPGLFDVLKGAFTGKGLKGDVVEATTRVGKLTLALTELRKQFLQFQERVASARGDAFLGGLEADRQRVAEVAAQLQQAATADFAEGKLSVEAFFRARREAMATAFAAELRAAQAQAAELGRRAAVAAQIDPRSPESIQAAAAAATARAAADQLSLRHQGELNALTREEVATERQVVDRVNEFNAALAEAQGQLEKASLNRLEIQIRDAREELERFGLSADEIERRLNDFRGARTAQIRLDSIQQAIDRAFAETDRLASEVQAQVDAGIITEREGRRQILAIERSRLPVLAALKAQLEAIATTLKDPAAIAAVAALVTQLDNAATAAATTGRAALDLELELRNVAESQLVTFLTSTASEARSVGDAFKQFARDAVAAINEVIARILVMKALDAAGFGFSGGGSVPQKKATGGLVYGPRRPVDQVPVWLTGGEYVFDTTSVSRAGLPFMRALHAALRDGLAMPTTVRANRAPGHFADGGLVSEGAAGSRGDRITAEIGLEDGLVLRALQTSAGVRAVLRIVAANPKSFNGALGRE